MTTFTLHVRNLEIFYARRAARDALPGPRIGDFVIFPDGREGRFSHDWGCDIQWSTGGSFYLGKDGGGSFSGGLNPGLHKTLLTISEDTRPGRFWFFDRDVPGAGRGVDVELRCRVYLCSENPR